MDFNYHNEVFDYTEIIKEAGGDLGVYHALLRRTRPEDFPHNTKEA